MHQGGRPDGRSTTVAARAALAAMVVALLATVVPAGAAAEPADRAQPVLVVLRDGVGPSPVAAAAGVVAGRRFDTALDGFTALVSPRQLARLRTDPRVRQVVPDVRRQVVPRADAPPADPLAGLTAQVQRALAQLLAALGGVGGVAGPGQVVPTAVERVGVLASPTADVDGVDERVDATIALVDTGVARHRDLVLAGGTDCVGDGAGFAADPYGHGTLVAGTAAALDNGVDAVGVAPGARLLSARAVDADGGGTISSLLCAIEWAVEQPGVDVLNLSLAWRFGFADEGAACGTGLDPLHEAVCTAVERGITVVAAAGNDGGDAADWYPAAWPEVLTVSGLADFDGAPGGRATSSPCGSTTPDDHLRPSSNGGAPVDLAAVATCVVTTAPGGGTTNTAGTSLAAPAVSGAVALLRAGPGTGPAPDEVRRRLLLAAEPGPIPGDRDAFGEGVLSVRGF